MALILVMVLGGSKGGLWSVWLYSNDGKSAGNNMKVATSMLA